MSSATNIELIRFEADRLVTKAEQLGVTRVYFGEHAEMDATQEARRCGGTAKAYKIYTTPQEPAAAWFQAAVKEIMDLADSYADATFNQGLNQIADTPTPEQKRQALLVAMLAAAPGGAA